MIALLWMESRLLAHFVCCLGAILLYWIHITMLDRMKAFFWVGSLYQSLVVQTKLVNPEEWKCVMPMAGAATAEQLAGWAAKMASWWLDSWTAEGEAGVQTEKWPEQYSRWRQRQTEWRAGTQEQEMTAEEKLEVSGDGNGLDSYQTFRATGLRHSRSGNCIIDYNWGLMMLRLA